MLYSSHMLALILVGTSAMMPPDAKVDRTPAWREWEDTNTDGLPALPNVTERAATVPATAASAAVLSPGSCMRMGHRQRGCPGVPRKALANVLNVLNVFEYARISKDDQIKLQDLYEAFVSEVKDDLSDDEDFFTGENDIKNWFKSSYESNEDFNTTYHDEYEDKFLTDWDNVKTRMLGSVKDVMLAEVIHVFWKDRIDSPPYVLISEYTKYNEDVPITSTTCMALREYYANGNPLKRGARVRISEEDKPVKMGILLGFDEDNDPIVLPEEQGEGEDWEGYDCTEVTKCDTHRRLVTMHRLLEQIQDAKNRYEASRKRT